MAGSARIEKLGIPGVYVCTDNFAQDALSAAEDVGMPHARIVTVAASDYYRLRGSTEGVKPVAKALIDKLIDALKRPLTSQEKNTVPK